MVGGSYAVKALGGNRRPLNNAGWKAGGASPGLGGEGPSPYGTLSFPRAVKALCHHIATEAGQLSFKRGDILRVLSRVDADWLRCSRREGAESGLVPIMYVTHLEDADY
ncbi:hypothetical protein L345_17837, partial [Ophiophagus hannah]